MVVSGFTEVFRRSTGLIQPDTYLTTSDLILPQFWVACGAGFAYDLDAARLQGAVQHVVDIAYPILTCRLRQDGAGRLFIDSSNAGFNFRTSIKADSQLRDVLAAFARPPAPEFEPLNACAEDFVEQLDPTGMLAGRSPLFGLVLTKVQGGSVLGLSLPHTLADAESIGQLLYDISRAYQGLSISPRPSSRLGMELMSMKAAGLHAESDPSEKEIIAHLPKYGVSAATLADSNHTGAYDLWGPLDSERQAGIIHSHHVFHLPDAGLSRLRSEIQQSNTAQDAGITRLSVHDIFGAVIWLAKEVSEGNDLSAGLKHSFGYAVDMRRLKPSPTSGGIPKDFWGNCVSGNAVLPPTIPSASTPSSSEHVKAMLAAAACAIHTGTQTLKADPNFISSVLALNQSATDINFYRDVMEDPVHPAGIFRDAAAMTSSWRSGTMDQADFGQGTAWLILGKVAPLTQLSVIITKGPGNDGVLCTPGFKQDKFRRLKDSGILEKVVPELVVI